MNELDHPIDWHAAKVSNTTQRERTNDLPFWRRNLPHIISVGAWKICLPYHEFPIQQCKQCRSVHEQRKNERKVNDMCSGRGYIALALLVQVDERHLLLRVGPEQSVKTCKDWVVSLFLSLKMSMPKLRWVDRSCDPSSRMRYWWSWVWFASKMCLLPCLLAHVQECDL